MNVGLSPGGPERRLRQEEEEWGLLQVEGNLRDEREAVVERVMKLSMNIIG